MIKFLSFNLVIEFLAIFQSVSWESAMVLSYIWINSKLNRVLGAFTEDFGELMGLSILMLFFIYVMSQFIQ